MPVDFMLVLVLLIDALEKRLSNCADPVERKRLRKMIADLDGWFERCLAERFADRDKRVDSARRRLDAARERLRRSGHGSARLEEVLQEISAVLAQLHGWWEQGVKSEK
ncbi:MAG: hypothetical protein RB296_05830 [Acidobacteriota bacterium]|jgi:hypothetical protein|nr:hypothetical protein [Acidobacteriota bacterium]